MRKSNKPLVRNELLITPDAAWKGSVPIQVGSPAWYAWLGENQGFLYEGSVGHLTARRELRRGDRLLVWLPTLEWKIDKDIPGKIQRTDLGTA